MNTDQEMKTREILQKIRNVVNENTNREKKQNLNEGVYDRSEHASEKEFPINENTPNFGDIRKSQEDTLIKTIGESLEFGNNALVYYPSIKDLVLNAKVNALNIAFQFRYNDSSGDGCYIWTNGMQLTDANSRTLGKIRDAFLNWKQNLVMNGDLMKKLQIASEKD